MYTNNEKERMKERKRKKESINNTYFEILTNIAL